MAGSGKFIGGRPVDLQKLSAAVVDDRQIFAFQARTKGIGQLVPDDGRGV